MVVAETDNVYTDTHTPTHTPRLPKDAGKWDTGSSGFSGFSLQIQLASSGPLKKEPSVMERSSNSAACVIYSTNASWWNSDAAEACHRLLVVGRRWDVFRIDGRTRLTRSDVTRESQSEVFLATKPERNDAAADYSVLKHIFTSLLNWKTEGSTVDSG